MLYTVYNFPVVYKRKSFHIGDGKEHLNDLRIFRLDEDACQLTLIDTFKRRNLSKDNFVLLGDEKLKPTHNRDVRDNEIGNYLKAKAAEGYVMGFYATTDPNLQWASVRGEVSHVKLTVRKVDGVEVDDRNKYR